MNHNIKDMPNEITKYTPPRKLPENAIRELYAIAMESLRQIADSPRKTVAQRQASATVSFIEGLIDGIGVSKHG